MKKGGFGSVIRHLYDVLTKEANVLTEMSSCC